MSASAEDYGHLITTGLVTGVGLAITIANAVFFDKSRKNCKAYSKTTADIMFWLNIILAIIFGLLFFWTVIRFFFNPIFTGKEKASKLTIRPNNYLNTNRTMPYGPSSQPYTTGPPSPSSQFYTTGAPNPVQQDIRTTYSGAQSSSNVPS